MCFLGGGGSILGSDLPSISPPPTWTNDHFGEINISCTSVYKGLHNGLSNETHIQ